MLTDKAIQAAKPRVRPYKLADGRGLTLLVNPVGSKLWRFRYRYDGREKMLGLGSYPDTSAMTTTTRCMSENTINLALRRMGYAHDEMTGHGFRSLASTCLNEQGYHPDLIELQLAHAERNQVRAAYNKAQRLPERRKMMQAWADYLDSLRDDANVVPIRRAS